ncbi:MAG: thioredoxin family protein [Candidatus Gastranaerophilales bacterium]|nr:thioredoxin family protein [Candidatus Gastranaerophilales bacterium]
MKNIISILLILIIPVGVYLIMSANSKMSGAMARDNNKPSLLIFTSSMCLDCKKIKSVIKEVEGDYTGKINFIQINALEKNRKVQENIKKYHVVLVPTLIFLDNNGNQTNKIEGFIPKEELIGELEEAING